MSCIGARRNAAGNGVPNRAGRTIEHRKPGILAALSETWKFRRFALYFGRRFLTKRYGRTWLGSSGSRSDPP